MDDETENPPPETQSWAIEIAGLEITIGHLSQEIHRSGQPGRAKVARHSAPGHPSEPAPVSGRVDAAADAAAIVCPAAMRHC